MYLAFSAATGYMRSVGEACTSSSLSKSNAAIMQGSLPTHLEMLLSQAQAEARIAKLGNLGES